MKNIFLSCWFILVACNNPKHNDSHFDEKVYDTSKYPNEILNEKMELAYDKTKWSMYCLQCQDTCFFSKKFNIKNNPLFATLDLKFEKIEYLNDTIELSFYFYYNSIRCDANNIYTLGGLVSGAAFKGKNDSVLYYLSRSALSRLMGTGSANPYVNPLQPDVIQFINNNSDKLNPWFREEAKRRGVIK